MENKQPFRCSFCGRTQDEVKRLVAGQDPGVFICNNCVELCTELLNEEKLSRESIEAASEDELLANVDKIKGLVRESIHNIMTNRVTASHLISDVYVLLEYVDKLKAILLNSRAR